MRFDLDTLSKTAQQVMYHATQRPCGIQQVTMHLMLMHEPNASLMLTDD